MTQDQEDELRAIGERLIAMAVGTPRAPGLASTVEAIADENLIAFAECEIRRRQARHSSLPSDIFGEGAWNILLDLFVMGARGKPVSISSACIASGLPPTTALRYIEALVALDLVFREDDPKDARRLHLNLSDKGKLDLRAALTAMMTASRVTRDNEASI
ncbi:winged helix DNA-binding protein [Qipengyuania sp. G39]|uniref:Winged helix DNA-binding protein n=1 Tax=Qipengyuania profundimaris TaxID=3067652 RepID=A0ABT9HLT4_9SPHN|nr:winged helix DNA-binding protein [Qipengyuania sp. G39]MDP4574117.1 winged helix DNA-binding protein [Qipengyuania sp. G39]